VSSNILHSKKKHQVPIVDLVLFYDIG